MIFGPLVLFLGDFFVFTNPDRCRPLCAFKSKPGALMAWGRFDETAAHERLWAARLEDTQDVTRLLSTQVVVAEIEVGEAGIVVDQAGQGCSCACLTSCRVMQ